MTLPTLPVELLELLALYPPGRVIFDAEARVSAYSNENSRSIDAPPEPGKTRVTFDVNFYGPDIETNMRSALSASKVLIEAGFEVEVCADKIVKHGGCLRLVKWGGTHVSIYAGREVVTTVRCQDGVRSEIEALVKPFGGDLNDGCGLAEGPPAEAPPPTAGSATSVRRRRGAQF